MRYITAFFCVILLFSASAFADKIADVNAALDRKDYLTAFKILQPLADEGNARAEAMLGIQQERGWGVKRDCKKASNWYHKAAQQGDSMGEIILINDYMKGICMPQDWQEAYFWLQVNFRQYHSQSSFNGVDLRDQSAEHFTAVQKVAIDKRVEDWMRAHPTPTSSARP